jgi:3'-phosphoadenosine 5'-phosphosulfate sulfotransferase (PAPS reductase)/FAD synthetase
MIVNTVDEIDPGCTDFALFSGGNDSMASTHKAHEDNDIDYAVYLDTNSGLGENLEYVKRASESQGWDLAILSSPYTLEEFALGSEDRQALGFPGPEAHSWAYNMFKRRQLGYLATRVNARPTYYSGVRTHESNNRMSNVSGQQTEADRWTWERPIHNWRDERVEQYRDDHDLPENPVTQKIGRSGDCYCGAFAHRDTEMLELEAHYPDHAEWLQELEQKVADSRDENDERCYWGFGGLSEKEIRAKLAEDDMGQMSLCSSCDIPDYPTAEDD